MKAPTTAFSRFFHAAWVLVALLAAQIASAASAVALDNQHAAVRAVMALQAEVTAGLMSSDAVLGTAVGADDASTPLLVVYIDRNHAGAANAIRSLPPQLR